MQLIILRLTGCDAVAKRHHHLDVLRPQLVDVAGGTGQWRQLRTVKLIFRDQTLKG